MPQKGFANLAHMGALHYIPVMFCEANFYLYFKKEDQRDSTKTYQLILNF